FDGAPLAEALEQMSAQVGEAEAARGVGMSGDLALDPDEGIAIAPGHLELDERRPGIGRKRDGDENESAEHFGSQQNSRLGSDAARARRLRASAAPEPARRRRPGSAAWSPSPRSRDRDGRSVRRSSRPLRRGPRAPGRPRRADRSP